MCLPIARDCTPLVSSPHNHLATSGFDSCSCRESSDCYLRFRRTHQAACGVDSSECTSDISGSSRGISASRFPQGTRGGIPSGPSRHPLLFRSFIHSSPSLNGGTNLFHLKLPIFHLLLCLARFPILLSLSDLGIFHCPCVLLETHVL